jgi:hypothetical protein
MLDFQNLTDQQKEFFSALWEDKQQQAEQTSDSLKACNAFIEKHRKQQESQAKAAEALKSRLV